MERSRSVLVGPRASWVVSVLGLLVSAAVVWGIDVGPTVEPDASANLPKEAESFDAARVDAAINPDDLVSGVVVVDRGGDRLTEADRLALEDRAAELLPDDDGTAVRVSDDGEAALISVPLDGQEPDFPDGLRADAAAGLPDGLRVQVAGGAAVTADEEQVTSAGVSPWLLAAAALLAAGLLAATTRSAWAWAVPTVVVGVATVVADRLAEAASAVLPFAVDGTTAAVTTFVAVTAGAVPALALLARYRQLLSSDPDPYAAMHAAGRHRGTTLASATGAVAVLASLLLADNPATAAVGWSGAIAVVVMTLAVLVWLPAVLSLCGVALRRTDGGGPTTPAVGASYPWARRRPGPAALVGCVAALALAAPLLTSSVGLAQAERFREPAASIRAQQTVAEHFPAGESDATIIAGPQEAVAALAPAVRDLDGVARVEDAGNADGAAVVDVFLDDPAGSPAAVGTVERLRAVVAERDGEVLVGGLDAEALDAADAAARDVAVVVPVVLLITLLTLVASLRRLRSAAVLTLGTVAVCAAGLGVGWVLVTTLLGWPALDLRVLLLAVVGLVLADVPGMVRHPSAVGAGADAPVPAAVVGGGTLVVACVALTLAGQSYVTLAQAGTVIATGLVLGVVLVRPLLAPLARGRAAPQSHG